LGGDGFYSAVFIEFVVGSQLVPDAVMFEQTGGDPGVLGQDQF